MSEARKFPHNSARSFALHFILLAVSMIAFSTVAAAYASVIAHSGQISRFDRKLASLKTGVLGSYVGAVDRILDPEAGASFNPVTVSLPDMTAGAGLNFVIPVTVGDTTGQAIRAFEFNLLYDEDIIVPQASPIDTVGTISAGMGVSINNTVPGILRVVFFSSEHRAGEGTLFNFRFTAVGADGEISPLTWQGFMFNEGIPAAALTDGSVELVDDRTITVTQTPNGTIVPGTTVVPFGEDQAFTITPAVNYQIVNVIVDGVSLGPLTEYEFLNVTEDHTITATFAITTFPITATSGPNGTVTPAGTTNVPFDGSQEYTITPGPDYLIEDVLVDGVSVGPVSTYLFENVMEPHTISATFVIKTFALTVIKAGNGSGTVTSLPAGINCGVECSEVYDVGTEVTLTAVAATGSTFTGWSGGGCTGTGVCEVTIEAATNVTATFVLQTFALNVSRIGNGSGTVTSDPAGIDCGADCAETYQFGTQVTLTATPEVSSNFTGWSGGGCTGTGVCIVTMDAVKNVTANFMLKTFALEVTKAGNGTGTVTSVPTGIDCGADCNQTYNYGVLVTLTAAADANSNFTGWSGAGCTGTGTCVVTMTQAAAVTATFTLKTFNLTVNKAGTGAGTITSAPPGINCGADCMETYNIGTVVTLSAAAGPGSVFDGWSGAGCSGTGTCVVTMNAAASVTANFTLLVETLTVIREGNGAGFVYSTPSGILCGSDCNEAYPIGSQVTLHASANIGSNFIGWSGGGCSGTAPTCVVTINAATTVTTTFTLQQYQLTVIKTGTGAANGTVTSTPAGINCGSDCDEIYNFGNAIALSATATPGTTFNGWSGGGCTGTGDCIVTVTGPISVTATFTIQTFGLSVSKGGNGFGVVTSSPPGIDCGSDCAEVYNIGTVVTLTAAPQTGSTFVGWSGACTGTGTCQVTMNQLTLVNANFSLEIHTLQVTKDGNGTGTVSSSPIGISCGADCSEPYSYGTTVTLTANATPDSDFTGWTGAGCSGTGTCIINITQAAAVTATFTLKSFTLNVDKDGNGTGTITSAPAGINCGGDCTEVYNIGTVVTLTAAAGSGSSFAGWSGGGCSGTGTCVVTMNAAASVTAIFNTFPFVEFSSAAYIGNESRTAVVTITRTGDLSIASSVTFSTSPGIGAVGAGACALSVDYVDVSQSVNFAPTETSKSVPVTLCPDVNIDPNETINVLLSAPVTANIGAQNTAVITINDTANQFQAGLDGIFIFSGTNSEPNPSVIETVDAPTGTSRVRVTLYDVWHAQPENLYALLVSPSGTKYVFMGATGGSAPVGSNSPVTLTFGDSFNPAVPVAGPLVTGAYRPTTCETPIADFPAPAPPGPYLEPGCETMTGPTIFLAFSGQNQNGMWQLYLRDSGTGTPFTLAGMVAGGWGLELIPSTSAGVEVSGRVLTPGLLGLRNAQVSLTDSEGQRRSVSTSSLGYFTFEDVAAGGTYVIGVSSRRYRFESKLLQVADNIQGLEMIGLE